MSKSKKQSLDQRKASESLRDVSTLKFKKKKETRDLTVCRKLETLWKDVKKRN